MYFLFYNPSQIKWKCNIIIRIHSKYATSNFCCYFHRILYSILYGFETSWIYSTAAGIIDISAVRKNGWRISWGKSAMYNIPHLYVGKIVELSSKYIRWRHNTHTVTWKETISFCGLHLCGLKELWTSYWNSSFHFHSSYILIFHCLRINRSNKYCFRFLWKWEIENRI